MKTGLPKISFFDINDKEIHLSSYKNKNLFFITVECYNYDIEHGLMQDIRKEWHTISKIYHKYKQDMIFFIVPFYSKSQDIELPEFYSLECNFFNTVFYKDMVSKLDAVILKPVSNIKRTNRHSLFQWFIKAPQKDIKNRYDEDGETKDVFFVNRGLINESFIKFYIHSSGVLADRFEHLDTFEEIDEKLCSHLQQEIVWTKEFEPPFELMESLWGQDFRLLEDEKDYDVISKIKIEEGG